MSANERADYIRDIHRHLRTFRVKYDFTYSQIIQGIRRAHQTDRFDAMDVASYLIEFYHLDDVLYR